jgi:hypothetical protein
MLRLSKIAALRAILLRTAWTPAAKLANNFGLPLPVKNGERERTGIAVVTESHNQSPFLYQTTVIPGTVLLGHSVAPGRVRISARLLIPRQLVVAGLVPS